MTTKAYSASPVDITVKARFWLTHESKSRLADGGNSRGAVPVHGKPSATAIIPLYEKWQIDAAILAEREAFATLCDEISAESGGWEEFCRAIRMRSNV